MDAGIGYGDYQSGATQGIRKSIAFEFDTYQDGAPVNDTSNNHISVHYNPSGPNSAFESFSMYNYSGFPPMNNGTKHVVSVGRKRRSSKGTKKKEWKEEARNQEEGAERGSKGETKEEEKTRRKEAEEKKEVRSNKKRKRNKREGISVLCLEEEERGKIERKICFRFYFPPFLTLF